MMIYPRARWRPTGGRGSYDPIKSEVYLHHDVTNPNHTRSIDTFKEQCAHMRRLDAQHQTPDQNYGGIGYSFVIFQPQGKLKRARVFEGRGAQHRPAAQFRRNTGTIAICLVGNLEQQGVKLATRWQLVRLLRLIRRNKSVRTLRGHRDVYATACPGRNLYALLPWLRKKTKLHA
jgi:hypothetical protein